jgi:outer membrane immunogenic protein
MKKLRTQLLATVAVLGLSGAAHAADLGHPVKAPAPVPIPYATWQGFYITGLVGAARLNETGHARNYSPADGPCSRYNGSCALSTTGVVGGVEVGYDWQSRYFVYGVAADWTWTGLKKTNTVASGISAFSHQAKIDWLASFRGRMGLAVDDTLVYFTGGLALGQIKSNASQVDFGGPHNYGALNTTQVGWVAGLGVEHKITQNWSFKGEVLYYDLGTKTATGTPNPSGGVRGNYSTEFSHEIIVGRVGVAYHF